MEQIGHHIGYSQHVFFAINPSATKKSDIFSVFDLSVE